MQYPEYRPRRLRRTENLRRLVRETRLSVDNLILPLFVVPGSGVEQEVASMPGVKRASADRICEQTNRAADVGIPAVILFGIPDTKDAQGSSAWDDGGVVQRAIREIKRQRPELVVITDVCLCEYTDHGHCGPLTRAADGTLTVDNDATVELLAREAMSHARAGADLVAPSDMMDGRVAVIREALDDKGFDEVAIMAYAAKYASAFYGPFRDAAESAPAEGDRRGYQMDPPNALEALREIAMDIEEGADIVMVKPAHTYLDVIQAARQEFDHPLAAYHVSGEYAMICAAARNGWLDLERAMTETLVSIRRAGADMILTYWAVEAAQKLRT